MVVPVHRNSPGLGKPSVSMGIGSNKIVYMSKLRKHAFMSVKNGLVGIPVLLMKSAKSPIESLSARASRG